MNSRRTWIVGGRSARGHQPLHLLRFSAREAGHVKELCQEARRESDQSIKLHRVADWRNCCVCCLPLFRPRKGELYESRNNLPQQATVDTLANSQTSPPIRCWCLRGPGMNVNKAEDRTTQTTLYNPAYFAALILCKIIHVHTTAVARVRSSAAPNAGIKMLPTPRRLRRLGNKTHSAAED